MDQVRACCVHVRVCVCVCFSATSMSNALERNLHVLVAWCLDQVCVLCDFVCVCVCSAATSHTLECLFHVQKLNHMRTTLTMYHNKKFCYVRVFYSGGGCSTRRSCHRLWAPKVAAEDRRRQQAQVRAFLLFFWCSVCAFDVL